MFAKSRTPRLEKEADLQDKSRISLLYWGYHEGEEGEPEQEEHDVGAILLLGEGGG